MFLGARMAAQKYGPPLVGTAETISAIPKPTNMATQVLSGPIQFALVSAPATRRTEEADDDPSYRHDSRAACVQAILEEPAGGH